MKIYYLNSFARFRNRFYSIEGAAVNTLSLSRKRGRESEKNREYRIGDGVFL